MSACEKPPLPEGETDETKRARRPRCNDGLCCGAKEPKREDRFFSTEASFRKEVCLDKETTEIDVAAGVWINPFADGFLYEGKFMFKCIEGAKGLVASATAAGAAYMMM